MIRWHKQEENEHSLLSMSAVSKYLIKTHNTFLIMLRPFISAFKAKKKIPSKHKAENTTLAFFDCFIKLKENL